MVRVVGLEPTRIASREPKSRMSTNSIIPADESGYEYEVYHDLKGNSILSCDCPGDTILQTLKQRDARLGGSGFGSSQRGVRGRTHKLLLAVEGRCGTGLSQVAAVTEHGTGFYVIQQLGVKNPFQLRFNLRIVNGAGDLHPTQQVSCH